MNLGPYSPSILLIDDNPDDRALVIHALREEFPDLVVQQISDAATLQTALAAPAFDIVITDFALRWTDGLAVLKAVQAIAPAVPVVMFTGTGTEEVAVQAMKAGFADYIVKSPRHFARLPFTVRSVLERQRQKVALRAAEDHLRHTQKLEALGQLAAGIAHDFNNLLTALRGYAELLVNDLPPDAPAGTDAQAILETTNRAMDLTRQLVRFSRREPANPVPLDLRELVDGFVPMLRRTLGASIDIRVAGDHVPIVADRGQIDQILLNLAVNARDAMPDGGLLDIEVTVVDELPPDADAPVPTSGRLARLAIRDNGQGMSDETRSRAFEPFFTTKTPDRGTGLGLASVYGIVTAAGGAVRIESALGKGTTVELFWPVT